MDYLATKRFFAGMLALALLGADPLPESDAVAITAAVQHKLNVRDFSTSAAREKNWAVAFWDADTGYGSGEALLKKSATDWIVVRMTTGSLRDVNVLEGLGVPPAIAQALVDDLTKFKAR
jgi:hypothetical protein